MERLTESDLPVIRSAGFKVGASGYVWYGRDIHGFEWKTYLNDDGDLEFSGGRSEAFGEYMDRPEFDSLFTTRL